MCSVFPAAQLLEVSGLSSGADAVEGHEPEAWSWGYAWQSLAVYPGRIYEPETVRGAGVALLALAITGLLVRARRALPFVAMLYVLFDLLLGPPLPLSLVVTWLTPFEMVSATRAADVAVLPLAILAGYGLDALADERKRVRLASSIVAVVVGALALWTLTARLGDGIWLEPSRWVIYAPALALAVTLASAVVPRHRAVLLALVTMLVFAELWAWNRSHVPALVVREGHDARLEDFLRNRPAGMWQGNGRGTIGTYNYNLYRLEPAINGYNPLHIERVRAVLAGPVRGREYRRAVRQTEIPMRNARGHLFMKRSFWLAEIAVPGPLPAPERWFAPTRYAYLPDGVPDGFPTLRPDEVPDQPYSETTEVLPLVPPESVQVSQDGRGERYARYSGVGPVALPSRHAVLEVAYRAVGPAQLRPYFETPDAARLLPGLWVSLRGTAGAEHAVRVPLPDMSSVLIGLETRLRGSDPPPEITGVRIVLDDADENARLEIVSRSADRVEVALRGLPGPRLLVFLDAGFPGWKATVDGRDVPIHRAQDAFKSVVVPAGDHTVVFLFSSRRVHVGVALSLLTCIAAGVALVVLGRPARG